MYVKVSLCVHVVDTPKAMFTPPGSTTVCLPLPLESLGDGDALEMVWPEKLHVQGDCYCPPYDGEGIRFSDCITTQSCNTEYSVSIVENREACFANLTTAHSHTPVYFTVVGVLPCIGAEGAAMDCYVRRISTSYDIIVTGMPC